MKFTRTLALIISITLVFTACNQESDQVASAVKENTNPLLAYVPADTAYVFAALESAPEEITDVYVARFQPVLDVMSKQVTQFQTDYEAGEYQDDLMARFATAVLDELGGSLSSESLEKFGISMQAHHAFYAMGVFPVMRFELSNATELRNAIGRIEAKMGTQLPVKELNGNSYWHMSDDGVDVGVYVAILDQQLAISVFPSNAEPELLAAFLGQEMPKESMASSNALAILNSEKGYSGYGSGILDFQKLADELMKPDSATRTYLGPESTEMLASLDAVCVAEIKSMIEKAPRMTGGLTEFSVGAIGMRYELEIDSMLAGKLAALVSSTPAATDGDNLMSASLAIQVGKLRAFVLEKATALLASPYQCEALAELNQNASELVTQLNIPMPPMVNNLMGIRARLDDFNPNAAMPEGTGLLALHVDKPEMFVGMASMMVPGFEALDLANQSEPVRIPAEMLPMADLDIFAMMNKNAIGAAVGEQQAGELGQFMSMKAQDNATFFSVSYDMAEQLKLQNAFYGSRHTGQEPPSSSLHELSTVAREAYMSTLGRSRVDMRFSGDGLIVDSRMTFK